jgi:hypothetical protein
MACIPKIFLGSTLPLCLLFTVLYKGMYTKIVVIVNAKESVDKSAFVHRINHLRAFKVAAQVVYQTGTVVGQDFECEQAGLFCTTVPVDIQ